MRASGGSSSGGGGRQPTPKYDQTGEGTASGHATAAVVPGRRCCPRTNVHEYWTYAECRPARAQRLYRPHGGRPTTKRVA